MWSQAIGLGVFSFIGIFILMSFVGTKHEASTCSAHAALAGVWDGPARTKLATLIGDPKAKALDLIDRWAAGWSAAYDHNCTKPDDEYAARQLCLESQRDSVQMLIEPRDVADAQALAQSELGVMLPSPEGCVRAPRVIPPPLPKDPALRGRLQEMRTLLLVLRGKLLSDEPVSDDTIRRANEAIAAVEKSDDASARAAAISVKSMVVAYKAEHDRDPKALLQVVALMRQAAELSEAAGDDRTRAQLMLGVLEMISYMPGFFADIDELLASAEAAVQHVKDPLADIVMAEVRARIAHVRGRWSEAIADYDSARKGWLERGSDEVYARMTIAYAVDLVNRHADGDIDHAIAALREAITHSRRPDTKSKLEDLLASTQELVAKADTAALDHLGYASNAAQGDATLVVTVAGQAAPTTNDDDATRASRTGIAEIMVRQGKLSWRVPVGTDGRFTLNRLAAGRYAVDTFVNSALGDLQIVHTDTEVKAGATTTVTLTYPIPHTETRRLGPAPEKGYWGVAIALPGKTTAATAAELKAAVDKAPWWSVNTVHSTRDGRAMVLEVELSAFSTPVTVCSVEGGYNDGLSPALFLGPDARPVHCE
jgi:tetratricopeptide (TPR) repeat protein